MSERTRFALESALRDIGCIPNVGGMWPDKYEITGLNEADAQRLIAQLVSTTNKQQENPTR